METRTTCISGITALLILCAVHAPLHGQAFDVLIAGGNVVDGTGAPAMRADVGIRGTQIAAVGDLRGAPAARVIDAAGLVVAPGIIDIHSHSDFALLADGRAQSKVHQGVTTEILGESQSAGPRRPDDTDKTGRMRANADALGRRRSLAAFPGPGSLRLW